MRWGEIARGGVGALLSYIILIQFGLTGLLVSLPFAFAVGWFYSKAKHKRLRSRTRRN